MQACASFPGDKPPPREGAIIVAGVMARQDLALALGVLAALWGVASSTPGPDVLVKPALAREARSAIEALAPETSHSSSLNGVEAVQLFGRARKALGRTQLAFLDSHADAKSTDLGGWDDDGDDESVTVSQALDLVRASAASGHREGSRCTARRCCWAWRSLTLARMRPPASRAGQSGVFGCSPWRQITAPR